MKYNQINEVKHIFILRHLLICNIWYSNWHVKYHIQTLFMQFSKKRCVLGLNICYNIQQSNGNIPVKMCWQNKYCIFKIGMPFKSAVRFSPHYTQFELEYLWGNLRFSLCFNFYLHSQQVFDLWHLTFHFTFFGRQINKQMLQSAKA